MRNWIQKLPPGVKIPPLVSASDPCTHFLVTVIVMYVRDNMIALFYVQTQNIMLWLCLMEHFPGMMMLFYQGK